jgi:hypothetical protein
MSTNPPAPQFANVAVSKDKTSATVTLGQTSYHLDARVLSDLITTLMIARADISPPIPQEPPANATLSVRLGNWGIAADEAKGDVLSGFPHPGFGWVGFRFSREHAEELARQLSACAHNIGPSASY